MSSYTIDDVRSYINERYCGWLDYSTFHCNNSGLPGEGVDLLNEVLINLLEKPDDMLIGLLQRRRNGNTRKSKNAEYRDLDFFVLRMIRMNVISPTAPYRHKFHHSSRSAVDENADWETLEREDVEDSYISRLVGNNDIDEPAEIIRLTNIIREGIEDIEPFFDPIDIKAFYCHYFDGDTGSAIIKNLNLSISDSYLYGMFRKIRNEVKIFVNNYDTRKLKIKSYWMSVGV